MDWASHIRRIVARLGEDASWTPDGGSPSTVRGVFLNPYQEITLGGRVAIAGSAPMFAVMIAGMPALADGDQLVHAGVTYNIKAPEPDTVGGFVLMRLELQPAP